MREVPKNKRYALGWYNEGITYLNIKEYDEALEFFEKALAAIPDHPDFLIGLGDVYFSRGQFADAYHQYLQALYGEPDNYRAWMKAGITLLKLERPSEALEIFQNLLEITVYDGELWFAHGLALLQRGEVNEAKESFTHARRYKPNQPALWYTLATLEEDPEEELVLLQRGYNMDPSNLDILLEMTRCLLRLGRGEEAIQYCERARTIAPDHPQISELMQSCMDTMQ